MTKNYTTEELTRMSAKSKLVPSLPVVEELENINETLKAMAEKEAFNVPEIQKFTLEGAELVTIKGAKGDKGEVPTTEELLELIRPLIPEKAQDGRNPMTVSKNAPLNPEIGDLWYQP